MHQLMLHRDHGERENLQRMEKLRSFLNSMSMRDQEAFARKCGSSRGHLRNIVNGTATCAPELAINIEREAGELDIAIPVEELSPNVDWAYIRSSHKPDMSKKKVYARK